MSARDEKVQLQNRCSWWLQKSVPSSQEEEAVRQGRGAQAWGTGGLAEAEGFVLLGLTHCTHTKRKGGLRALSREQKGSWASFCHFWLSNSRPCHPFATMNPNSDAQGADQIERSHGEIHPNTSISTININYFPSAREAHSSFWQGHFIPDPCS